MTRAKSERVRKDVSGSERVTKHVSGIGLPLILLLFATSCTKNISASAATAELLGNWNLVSDSSFAGVGSGNHPVDYEGQAGDYFDFRSDGNIYTKEGNTLDTLSYQLVSGSSIIIASFGVILNGVPGTCEITTLTAHKATIVAKDIYTPGGTFGRKVILTR
jgi:hypothetical protein